jgi:hypothetical protein
MVITEVFVINIYSIAALSLKSNPEINRKKRTALIRSKHCIIRVFKMLLQAGIAQGYNSALNITQKQ